MSALAQKKPLSPVAERSQFLETGDKGWARRRAASSRRSWTQPCAASDMKGMALGGAGRAEDGRTGLGPPTPQAFLLPPLWTPSFPKEPVSLITCREWETRNPPQILGVPRIRRTLEPVGTAAHPGRAVTGEHARQAPRAPGQAGRRTVEVQGTFPGAAA